MMRIEPLSVQGAWQVTPDRFPDDRGVFFESFRADQLAAATGHDLQVKQTNISTSSRGTLRGIHFADVPPGQAKYVTALSGTFLDFVVDIRVGSPTFGSWDVVTLDMLDNRAVFISEGLGHALLSLEDGSTAMYLCSQTYAPTREHGVDPLDPEIGLELRGLTPLVSPKDIAAPTLAEAREAGLLPTFAANTAHRGR